ncbi:MAG TPA: adenylyl-sulfate kinase, partial [Gammaproteobacteria bacterium]|nr:adenylyl-sulfate kinase [Gammaproteobacteria bacterium]
TDLTFEIDQQSGEHLAAKVLSKGQIAYCKIALDEAIPCDPESETEPRPVVLFFDASGAEILGICIIDFALRRATNISWHQAKVDQSARARVHSHQPCVIWVTGLSGSGKSTVADALEQELHRAGRHTYLLDGDNVRHGLCRDLGFTDADRVENIRRVAEVATLMADAGLIVIASFISPFQNERAMAREVAGDTRFVEVFVDTPLAVCEARDPKGLYKKARAGELKNFTGIDSIYEAPSHPEITLKAGEHPPEVLVGQVMDYLSAENIFSL